MRPSESNREKAKVWTARIEQAEQFRGSTVEFCQKEVLSIHTFRHWKRKLQDLEHNESVKGLIAKKMSRLHSTLCSTKKKTNDFVR